MFLNSENVSLPPQEPENTDGKVSINFTNSAAKADDEKSDVIQVNQSQMTLPGLYHMPIFKLS